jgi:hypothetical protein
LLHTLCDMTLQCTRPRASGAAWLTGGDGSSAAQRSGTRDEVRYGQTATVNMGCPSVYYLLGPLWGQDSSICPLSRPLRKTKGHVLISCLQGPWKCYPFSQFHPLPVIGNENYVPESGLFVPRCLLGPSCRSDRTCICNLTNSSLWPWRWKQHIALFQWHPPTRLLQSH